MASRRVFDVSPDGDRWKVQERQGGEKQSHETKEEAVQAARALADEAQPSQVVIRKSDGQIEEERTYGNDPFPPEG
jgi:hypothetical protein